MFTRNLQRVGALALLLGTTGFIAIFLYLRSAFGYPDVLDQSAAEVLPRLAEGGAQLRAAWLLYSALPLTLLIAGIASMPLLEDGGGRGLARLGAAAASLAAVVMMLGLLRWPSLHDTLAARWAAAPAAGNCRQTATWRAARPRSSARSRCARHRAARCWHRHRYRAKAAPGPPPGFAPHGPRGMGRLR